MQEVDDLADKNSIVQGQTGYNNEEVHVGDLVLEIDGRDVTRLSIADLHDLLRGEIYTLVEITLKRRQSASVYTVEVLRHRFHEFDSSPSAAEARQSTKIGSLTPSKEAAERGRGEEIERERQRRGQEGRTKEMVRGGEKETGNGREPFQRGQERESHMRAERPEEKREREWDGIRAKPGSKERQHDELKNEQRPSRSGKDEESFAPPLALEQRDQTDSQHRLEQDSIHFAGAFPYNGNASSPPSLDTSPPTLHANDTASIANGSESARALLEQLKGLEHRFNGLDRRSEISPGIAAEEKQNSAHRHAALNDKAHGLLQACRRAQNILDELVSSVGKLPAKRQSLRLAGSNTRTTVMCISFTMCPFVGFKCQPYLTDRRSSFVSALFDLPKSRQMRVEANLASPAHADLLCALSLGYLVTSFFSFQKRLGLC